MERDRFEWMIKFCKPTAAQEAELAKCPFAREFENFEESSPLSPSQSPLPTPMTPIRMVSPPPTQSSADRCMEGENAVYHTPPEHHADSQLEDRNPNDLRAEKVTILEAKRAIVVAGEEFDGDTVPLSETEVVETEGDGGVGRTMVLSDEDLLIASWLGKCYAANQAEAAARGTRPEVGGLMNNGAAKLDAINVEGIGGEKPNGSSDSSGSSESCEIVGYKSCETVSSGLEKGIEMAKSAEKTPKDGRNGGVRSNGKRNEKIDSRKRELSPSCKGKEKDAGDSCELVGYKSCETESAGFEKGVEIAKSAEKTVKDDRNGGLRSNGKRNEKIDGRKRKLSPSCKGKEKVAEGSCEIVGYKSCETESTGFEKGNEMAKSAEKTVKDGRSGGVRSNGERNEKTDNRKRKLSPSCKGKEKVEEGSCEILGYKSRETELGGLEKGVGIAKSAEKTVKDDRNGGVRSNVKRNEKIDNRKRKLSPSCKGKEKVAEGGCEILGYKSRETEPGGLEKGVEIAKSAETSAKDGHGNEDVRSRGKKIVEKTDGRKRKLPPWCTGKEKDTGECSKKQSFLPPLVKEKGKDEGGSSKKKNGLSEFLEFLDFLRKHFKYKHDDIAANFVEPRIWKRL